MSVTLSIKTQSSNQVNNGEKKHRAKTGEREERERGKQRKWGKALRPQRCQRN